MPDLPPSESHPVLFDGIDGQLIHETVLKMDGAAGFSDLDAAAWKRLFLLLLKIFVNQ